MKKIFVILLLLIAAALAMLLTSCKTRKVSKQTLETTDKSNSASTETSDAHSLDTSKKTTDLHQTIADSSTNELEVVNDSGKVVKVDIGPDGSIHYSGMAKKFTVKTKRKQLTNLAQKTQVQKAVSANIATKKAATTDTAHTAKAANKNTEAKTDVTGTLEIIGVLLLVVVVIYIYYRWRYKPLAATLSGLPVFKASPPPEKPTA